MYQGKFEAKNRAARSSTPAPEQEAPRQVYKPHQSASEAAKAYVERGVYVFERESPSHYSKRIVESFGLKGVVRVSPIHCNSPEEVDQFLRVTEEIARFKR